MLDIIHTISNCNLFSVAPTIDKGAGGSKSVKVNRMTVWRINVKGEPPPTFSWWKDGHQIVNSEEHQMEREEYQGGSTAILQVKISANNKKYLTPPCCRFSRRSSATRGPTRCGARTGTGATRWTWTWWCSTPRTMSSARCSRTETWSADVVSLSGGKLSRCRLSRDI